MRHRLIRSLPAQKKQLCRTYKQPDSNMQQDSQLPRTNICVIVPHIPVPSSLWVWRHYDIELVQCAT